MRKSNINVGRHTGTPWLVPSDPEGVQVPIRSTYPPGTFSNERAPANQGSNPLRSPSPLPSRRRDVLQTATPVKKSDTSKEGTSLAREEPKSASQPITNQRIFLSEQSKSDQHDPKKTSSDRSRKNDDKDFWRHSSFQDAREVEFEDKLGERGHLYQSISAKQQRVRDILEQIGLEEEKSSDFRKEVASVSENIHVETQRVRDSTSEICSAISSISRGLHESKIRMNEWERGRGSDLQDRVFPALRRAGVNYSPQKRRMVQEENESADALISEAARYFGVGTIFPEKTNGESAEKIISEDSVCCDSTAFISLCDGLAEFSHSAASVGEVDISSRSASLSRHALDLAVDFIPGVSQTKNMISIITGVNPITGESISDLEKGIAAISLLIPGGVAVATKSSTGIRRISSHIVGKGTKEATAGSELAGLIQQASQFFREYGTKINALSLDADVKKWMSGWDTGLNGINQLINHSTVKGFLGDTKGLVGLEEKAGLSPGALSKFMDDKSQEKIKSCLENMHLLALRIKRHGVLIVHESKIIYWISGAREHSKGIALISTEKGFQSVMPMRKRDFQGKI